MLSIIFRIYFYLSCLLSIDLKRLTRFLREQKYQEFPLSLNMPARYFLKIHRHAAIVNNALSQDLITANLFTNCRSGARVSHVPSVIRYPLYYDTWSALCPIIRDDWVFPRLSFISANVSRQICELVNRIGDSGVIIKIIDRKDCDNWWALLDFKVIWIKKFYILLIDYIDFKLL